MASSVGWLDQSEEQQRKMREVIALFAESGTVDDIGIGVVRDAFSDLLFPGLSTVQTRVRYFLFVPWVYQRLEADRVPSHRAADTSREWELELIFSLLQGGDSSGVIGRDAKETLKQLPSFIYWSGLRSFGIRNFSGTRNDYVRAMDRFNAAAKRRRADGDEVMVNGSSRWHTNLPAPPGDLWESATLQLTSEEAHYLQERFVAAHPESLLAFLARAAEPVDPKLQFPWDAVDTGELPPVLAKRLETARYFSEAIHGASQLYNLRLAEAAATRELLQAEQRVETYRKNVAGWKGLMEARRPAHQAVSLHDFWSMVYDTGARITPGTRHFVNEWLTAVADHANVDESPALSELIRDRERRLKKGMARLSNPRALEMWGGASGANRLTFRWAEGRDAVNDIATGLVGN